MPYIPEKFRDQLDANDVVPESAGELNYCLTRLIEDYRQEHGTTYKIMNDILGAIEGAKLEFYRRVVVPYEDQKCFDNGDVYV